MLAKLTYKNQLTLPQQVLKEVPETEYFDVSVRGQEIVLKPVRITPVGQPLAAFRRKMGRLRITEKDVDKAVRWARKGR